MAFGWKTEYEKRIKNDYPGNWELFSIVRQACEDLEWEYLVVDENTFTATTPTGWTLNEEIITIKYGAEEIVFNSQSESIELYEGGRNKRNLEEFLLPAIDRVRKTTTDEKLAQDAASLRQESLQQLKTGNRVFVERLTFGFKGHQVTFGLIIFKLLVFVFISLQGVSMFDPSIDDILKWGGNTHAYTTGGEWWRLITNMFIHIGALHLLVNLLAFYFIGLFIESLLGHGKFFIAYLSTGIIASLVGIMWDADGVTAGTSGSLFGIYGVFVAFASTNYISKKFSKSLLISMGLYLVFTVAMSLNTDYNIELNIAGLLAGIIIGYLFYFFHFKKNRARAGGTRISVEILLITGLLVYFYLNNGKDDSLRFQKTVMKLNQIEMKAMLQLQRLQFSDSNEEAARVLKDSTLPEWKYFRDQISKTSRFHLDEEFDNKRKLLQQYAKLRVVQTELIYKSIKEETDKYDKQIEKISDEIESLIDQMGY